MALNLNSTYAIPLLPRNRVVRHVAFWIFVYLLDVFVFGIGYENVPLFLRLALLEMPGQLFFAYVVIYWIAPRYLKTKDHFKWSIMLLIAFIVCGLIGQYLFIEFRGYANPVAFFDIPKIFLRAFYSFLKACLALLVKFGLMWYQSEQKVTNLENARLSSELKMLKDQVNPHFLFNTLNSLFGLIGSHPEQAQACVIKLSGILQFMLHESNHAFIRVSRELECIMNYIALEQIRYSEKLSVSVNIDPRVNDVSITPLLLFPLVENSFKHGVADHLTNAWVNLQATLDDKVFTFTLENSKAPKTRNEKWNGIGLTNVKRRLQLVYGDCHELQITETDDSFLVTLKLYLGKMNSTTQNISEHEMSYR